ncbi:MAG: Zn-dependent protease with chaperone function [Betaproteobacteria bacterium]|nr:Zn-dependent protease with chaperone function [Betaproteobacteria bacterium]
MKKRHFPLFAARLCIFPLSCALALLLGCARPAWSQAQPKEGVDVGKPSSMARLVPAGQVEQAAGQQYEQLKQAAIQKNALAPPDDPRVRRIREVARRILPFTPKWNPRAAEWKWEINLIGSRQINAFCMPGGKIAFYTGIIDGLQLSDDEIAIVMGHEIAHALREHARERIAKQVATNAGANILSHALGLGRVGSTAVGASAGLLSLKFSRDDETEADTVGLELAARAGYDPRAGITLWRKMQAANKGAPPQWFSTHPGSANRIKEIERHLPQVMPLYQRALQAGVPVRP